MRVIHVPAELRPMIEDSADFERSEQREQFEREEMEALTALKIAEFHEQWNDKVSGMIGKRK